MRKVYIVLFIVSFSLNGFSKVLNGIDNIDTAVKSFFDPLKKGSKNIDEAIKVIPSLNGEVSQYGEKSANSNTEGQFKDELKKVMVTEMQGGVSEYKETDSRTKLNGAYVIKTYQVRFKGGEVKSMQFKFLRPTTGPEYQFVDAQMIK